MMKSEYDRTYQWYNDEGEADIYFKKRNRDTQLSEPRMTHKRRVKLTEDNVVIGEPLLHQTIGDMKENISIKNADKKRLEKFKVEKIMRNESKRRMKNVVNEAVQTDIINNEKSTQLSKNIPESKGYANNSVEINRNTKENNKNHKPLREDNNVDFKYEKSRVAAPAPAQSEYQKKYAWQNPVSNNPPQNDKTAEMKSSWDTKLKIYNNFISEYQRQFRPYEYVTENRYKKMKPIDDTNLKFVPDKKDHRRPRALTPPPQVNIKNKSYKASETLNPQRMGFPHGKQKRFLTEYSANFDNKWERLDAEMAQNVEEKAREANSQAKWFQEILELRKKAQEYRQRSRGTHFSREHLGQVYGHKEDSDDEGDRRKRRIALKKTQSSSIDRSISSLSSKGSSSTVVVVSASRSRSPSPMHRRTAGKPTRDDSLLLDEGASHDTALKSPPGQPMQRPITASPNHNFRQSQQRCVSGDNHYPIKNERQYTLEKYFNIERPEQDRRQRTLDYDSVSKASSKGGLSTRSIISSSTMSLAIDTLERAKRNRDELLRQKS